MNEKRILLVWCAVLGLFCHTNAQQILPVNEKAYVDSLQQILQSKKTDSVKTRANFLLSNYWRSKDTLKSKDYLAKGRTLSKANAYLSALALYYEGEYEVNKNNGKAIVALQSAEKALSIFASKEAYLFRASAWYDGAILQRGEKGDSYLIDVVLNKAIPLAQKSGDDEKLAHYYSQLAVLFMYNAQFDKAEIYNNKAIAVLERKYPGSSVLLLTYLAAASNYCYANKNKEARNVLDKAHALLKPYPESLNYPYYYYNEALYLIGISQFEKALVIADKGIPLAKKYNQNQLLQQLLFRKYETFSRLKKYAQAKELLLGLLKEGTLRADINNRRMLYDQLAQTNANMGLMAEAYKWATMYNKTSDSLANSKLKESISALEIKFRTAENQKKIGALNAANEKAKLQAKNEYLIRWLLIGIVLVLLVAVIVGWFFYRNSKKLALQKELIYRQELKDVAQQEQIKIAQAVLNGQEEERNRVARDLHDGLGGMLANVKLNLSDLASDVPNNGKNLTLVVDQLDGSIKELRRIAHNMVPEMLLKLGLETSLKDLCESVPRETLAIDFQYLGVNNNLPVPEQIAIYRIVQELLTNVVKHAQAKNVLLQCTQNETLFLITIEDDGKGFDSDRLIAKQGMGLFNIKNRVDYLKGKLEVLSAKNKKGTIINIELNVSA